MMNMKVAGFDLFRQGLDNEYRLRILEEIIDKILIKQPDILTAEELSEIRTSVVKRLQNKYPEAGIQSVEGKNE